MNYSTLLDRSVDFDPFSLVFDPNYPDWVDRQLAILLAQMLWDRGENNGYVQHLTDNPYRRTSAHRVMLYEAFGDHQVANVATEVMARTIDAELRVPALAQGAAPMCSRSGASTRPGACPTAAARTWWSGTSAPRPRRWRTSPTGQARSPRPGP